MLQEKCYYNLDATLTLLLCVTCCITLFASNPDYTAQDAFATHNSKKSQPCSVYATGQMFPVLYNGGPRNNPDGTFYPGDSFYYLIRFSASSTCVGLTIRDITSHDGIDLDFHSIVSWRQLPNVKWATGLNSFEQGGVVKQKVAPIEIASVQRHLDMSHYPKRLTTTYYYTGPDYWGSDNTKNKGDYPHNQKLLFSIREDQTLSPRERAIRSDSYSYPNRYVVNTTAEWVFTNKNNQHAHFPLCTEQMLADRHTDFTRNRNILTSHNRSVSCQVPDVYVDDDSQDSFEDIIRSRCSTVTLYSGCIFGKATINGNIKESKCLFAELDKLDVPEEEYPDTDTCVNLEQKLEQKLVGYKKTCGPNGRGSIICKSIPVYRDVTLAPDIIKPDLNVVLNKIVLQDSDGYDTRNLDGTYYIWDPITIQHIPTLKWKNSRDNTIHFEIKKGGNDLTLERYTECKHNRCDITLQHKNMVPISLDIGNGDGIAIHNATVPPRDLGLHDFVYNVTAYNNDVVLDQDIRTITGLVVAYKPKYVVYPYSLLSDDHRTSYENRAAVALHYFGSYGGGAKYDDDDTLHEDRRSKINDFSYVGIGFDPWRPVVFNNTLHWSESIPPETTLVKQQQQQQHNHFVTQTKDFANITISHTAYPDVTPCISTPNTNTLTLVRAGYCKIYFDYDNILDTVHDITGPQFENATLFNTLISAKFAGFDTAYLSHYVYRFPEPFFHTILRVVLIGYDNNANLLGPMTVHITANKQDDNSTLSLSQYIHEKVMYDSSDMGFADMISGDLYDTTYNTSDTKTVDILLRRVASKFETYQNNAYDTTLPTVPNNHNDTIDIIKLSGTYLQNPQDTRLNIPLDVGLGALSPTLVDIAVANQSKQHIINYIDFGSPYTIYINLAQNNTLNITRYPGIITVVVPTDFGRISAIHINDILVPNASCSNTSCMIVTTSFGLEADLANTTATITVQNVWGGRAYDAIPDIQTQMHYSQQQATSVLTQGDSSEYHYSNFVIIGIFVMFLPVLYWIYRRVTHSG